MRMERERRELDIPDIRVHLVLTNNSSFAIIDSRKCLLSLPAISHSDGIFILIGDSSGHSVDPVNQL